MDSVTDSGGRVTRAARKRLASFDSDNGSSRPGTPVQSKLAAVATNSPLKPRMTRRHSTSGVGTPVKTPGKRLANAVSAITEAEEVNVTPARRGRSISKVENEETPKLEMKAPNFESLEEERLTTRITRSKSKSPEQPKVKAKSAWSQRGRKSMVRKDAGNFSHTKADTNFEIEKDKTDSETAVVSIKKDKLVESNSLPTKPKSLSTENDKDNKILNNKKDELESNPSPQKGESSLADVNNDKRKVNELSDPPKSLSNIDTTTSQTPVRKDQGKTIASPQKRNILSISATEADEKAKEKNDSNNSDNDKSISLSKSVNITYEKSAEKEEADHVRTSQAEDSLDKSSTYLQDRKSLSINVANTSGLSPENPESVGEKLVSKTKMNAEDKTKSPLKRQSLSKCVSPMKNDDRKTPEYHVEQEMRVESLVPEEGNTTHGNTPSRSVVLLKEEPVELLDANITANVGIIPAENYHGAEPPNRVDDLQTEADMVNVQDVISKNTNESVKTVGVTSSPSSDTKSDAVTPPRDGSEIKAYDSTDGDSLKRVGFSLNISEDECEKSIYPKTPASAKGKGFIEIYCSRNDDKSFQGESCSNNDSVVTVHDTTDVEIPETQQEATTSAKSANKTIADDDTIVSIVEDDDATTEIEKMSSLSQPEMGEDKSIDKDYSRQDDTELCEVGVFQESTCIRSPDITLKWYNPSVVAKGSKLDTITKDEKTADKPALDDGQKFGRRKKKRTLKKRAEWNDDDESPYEEDDGDEYMEEEDEEEKMYARKHPFHDDEVMVVDDYESGDSMDSEERREIMENETAVDGESIGSHTTEGDDNDEDESENDSFIVSDNCDEEEIADFSRSEYDDEVEESNDVECIDREKKQYKRIQRVTETSSSDEDEPSKANLAEAKDVSDQLKFNKSLNTSRLSDSARRLQSAKEDESDNSNKEDAVNTSRKDILRKLNQSDRFNKSVRDLNPEVDVSPDALATANTNNICVTSAANMNGTNTWKSGEFSDVDPEEEEPTSTSSNVSESDLKERKKVNVMTSLSRKHSESHLGEVSVTSEEENCNDNGGSDTDDEKENAEAKQILKAKQFRGLSTSFGNFKRQKAENSLQKKVLQRSFTIGVSVNGGELETAVFQNKVVESKVPPPSSASASLSSNEDTDGVVLSSDDARYLENFKHMPLGNPLVRTRRQSLALPTNPDMEIGTAQHNGSAHKTKNHKRKSLAVLSGNDFNPSQSFIDSLELRKAELQRRTCKRKRLSKSFGGTTADNSVIDIDVRHLHKRSKISSDNSFVESFENTKPDNSICLKAGQSSTPHDKGSTKNHNNSGIRRILSRCDEILEAANRAKLEAKLNYQKSKIRLPKRNKKRMKRQLSSPETKRDRVLAPITKEFKKRDKAKIAVTQALKASADIIIGKQRKQPIEVGYVVSNNRLPSDVVSSIADSQSTVRNIKKEHTTEQNCKYRNYSTAAGNVVEMLQSPERKKKAKIIRLPTGKVCVEPITPTKRSILTCNGMEFYESPMTPCAVGFKVREVLSSNINDHPNKDRKREHNYEGRKYTPTPQWTQSGPFIEEEISCAQLPLRSVCHGNVPKKTHLSQYQANNSNFNFKQSALHRGDIKRNTAREMLQLRERRQMHEQY